MPETKQKETAVKRSQKEIGDDGAVIKDKLSIQQILEGMTNEFNKAPGKKKPADGSIKKITQNKTEKSHIKVVEDAVPKVPKSSPKVSARPSLQNNHDKEEAVKVVSEKAPEEKTIEKPANGGGGEEPVCKHEAANKNRIVLTFKTIDEKTDNGKKTKISSCPSNLTLVPEELHCNPGGVSVRIENFEEPNGDTSKAHTNGDKSQKLIGKVKSSNEVMDTSLPYENHRDIEILEKLGLEKLETRKLKQRNHDTGLKRSARRLSKESPNSTVLESAMARKEKFNYTVETIKRKYTKPGRPKKLTPEKKELPKLNPIDPTKLTQSSPDKKPAMPKLCPLNSLKKIYPTGNDGQSASLDSLPRPNKYEGMPKLTPIIKSCEIIQPMTQYTEVTDTSSMKSTVVSKDLNEVFLKPIPKKANEKSRPKVQQVKRGASQILNGKKIENGIEFMDYKLNVFVFFREFTYINRFWNCG